jgi:serine-aspartate repeat-containing protein C/D/E
VGIFSSLRDLYFGSGGVGPALNGPIRGPRRCQIEELEPRRLFAVDVAPHVLLGSVYFEEATGDDSKPDIIQVSFTGGAAGTTLNTLTINGDKRLDGLSDGDVFFDTAAGGLGAFQFDGLKIESANGFQVNGVTVVDGGTQIIFDLSGFDAGEKLVFSVDVDEAQYVDGPNVDSNSLVEGEEFQRSHLVGKFSAVGYVDLTLPAQYWDDFDTNFAQAYSQTGLSLDLPNDKYTPEHDYTDRTAGAIAHQAQIPLATISGWVYHDRSNDGVFNTGTEQAIGGVTVELLDANGTPTGITTTTSTDPAKLGFYEFRNLTPGTYGVRETQPSGWLDGKDTAGDHGGVAAVESGAIVDRITGAVLGYGDHGLNYNFGELLPGSITGIVEAHHDADCDFDEPPEITLQGVQVDLLNGNGQLIRSTFTDANGRYTFDGLVPGIYQVFEHQPADYYEGAEHVGSAGGVLIAQDHIININIGSDVHAVHYDFCEHIGVNLSGNVYHDRSNDGIFNRAPGGPEEGIGGVVLKLIDADGQDTGKRATTNAAGYYQFLNLAAGTYTVIEVQPSPWLDGKDTPGNSGGVAAVSPPGDMISQITLNWGVDGIEYNFGELLPGSISGHVLICDDDIAGEGQDIPIPNVRVDLLNGDGQVIDTTLTNDKGEYSFTNLPPGTYRVLEHQPAGYFDDEAHIGSGDGVIATASSIVGIHIGSDQKLIDYDFCEVPPGSIRGQVQAHTDEDCDFDHPEKVLSGVTIELRDGDDGHLIATTTTDQNGEYAFENLPAGHYAVHEIQPAGYYDGDERVGTAGGQLDNIDSILNIHLPAGFDAVHYDFCEHIGVNLSGNVYHDRNDDGVFNRAPRGPEEGIGGVVLKLIDADGHDTGKRAATNADGYYQFLNLAAGTYTVIEIQPSPWLDGKDTPGNSGGVAAVSPPGDMISQITLNWGVDGVEYNFGELLPGSISGHVQICDDDIAGEGQDIPIPNVRVDLLNGDGQVIETTLTNAQGQYSFTNLRPGTYTVSEHQPAQFFDDEAHIGSGDGVIFTTNLLGSIHISSDEDLVNYDFCELPPAELSGYVFIDEPTVVFAEDNLPTPEEIAAIRDGSRTPDDTPLPGVTLELRNGATGAPILVGQALPGSYGGLATDPIRVLTDANGYYHFGGLRAGSYAVVEIQPDGLMDNVDTPGTTGGFAANPVGLWSSHVAVPTAAQQTVIDQFRAESGTDAIALISLTAGQHSQENNFSEVQIQPEPPLKPPIPPLPPIPPPPPPEKPPVFPPLALQPPPFLWAPPVYVPNIPPEFIPSGDVGGYTWHLSVVNAGWPRSMTPTEARFQLTSTQIDVANWQSVPLARATWTLAILDGSKVVIERQGVLGNEKAIPVTGDFNGDGVTDIGVYIDGQWFLDLNGNGRWDEGDLWAKLGTQDDLPVTGDWDADGKTDIGIYGPAWSRDPWAISREPGLPDADNFPNNAPRKFKNMPPKPEDATDGARMLRRTARGKSRADLIDHVFHYGEPGDVPLSGDWNGDGVKQIGVFHDGQWYLDLDGDGKFTERDAAFVFGQAGDIPVVGDFNGDGVDDIGVYRNGHWIVDTNGNHKMDAKDKVFELGGAGDKPVVGDWNDDGVDDPGVYHPGPPANRVAKRAG